MKTTKQLQREARHLFRLCMVNGSLDERLVRQVIQGVLASKRHGYLALVNKFERLVKLEQTRQTAEAESKTPASHNSRPNIEESSARMHGPRLSISFVERHTPNGGIRVRVGSDAYDGRVKESLAGEKLLRWRRR